MAVSLYLLTILYLVAGQWTFTGALKPELLAYELFPGLGYFKILQTTTFNWSQSLEWCNGQVGHLAVPNSEAEADLYKVLIAQADPIHQNMVFIGFHDLYSSGEYETVLDSPLATSGYTRWALGAPNVSPTLRCGGFSKDGGLLNLNCGLKQAALTICELPLWFDYELVPGVGNYKFHVDAKVWSEAWQSCREEGSHLAVVNSEEEYVALQEIFSRYPLIPEADLFHVAWVGVHAKFEFNKFRTVVGPTLANSGFSKWEAGFPNYAIDNAGMDVGITNSNGSLITILPNFKLAYFCEREL